MIRFASACRQVIPLNPFYLVGYAGSQRELPASGIRDIPEVHAVCIETTGGMLCMISVDVCVYSEKNSCCLRKQISSRFGIVFENISICALHSHSCPNGTVSGRGFNEHNENASFLSDVENAAMDAVEECLNGMEEAKAKVSTTIIKGCYSNRNDLNELYDPSAILMVFENLQGKRLGSILNISVHSTVLGPSNMLCSYDLVGTVRTYIKDHLHCDVLALMGAAGDTSNRQYRRGDDFEELRRTASLVSSQILNNQDYADYDFNLEDVKLLQEHISYDDEERHEYYREKLRSLEEELKSPEISKDQYKLSLTSKVIFESKLKRTHVDFKVTTKIYDLSSVVLVMFSGEMSSILGLRIKKSVKRPVIICTCCDDDIGYFIEKEKYGKYYETISTDVPAGIPEKITESIIKSI